MISIAKWLPFLASFVAAAISISDQQFYLLPKLFHLDDYERCLSPKDGLYCLGTFEIASKTENNSIESLIKQQSHPFNRSLLHRGYCLSSRCPSNENNATLRFEQCTNKQLSKYPLTARLKKLSYCTNHAERIMKETQAPDSLQKIFLYVVFFIFFLNVLGTLHDVYTKGKKNILLLAWSLPLNWKRLTTIDNGSSSMLAAIHSSKITLHLFVMYSHSVLLHNMVYVYNSEAWFKDSNNLVNMILRNGTSLVQVFVLISSFFTAYSVLVTAQRSVLNAGLVAKWILKRIFRIAPVYLLLTGYAATWWPRAGDGPMWPAIVEAESAICRRKFWTHALFINNFVEGTEICLVQSWAMAVEVQLFLASLGLTVLFIKLKVRAAPILGVMFLASCLLNITLAYAAGLVPMVKIIVPEKMRVLFRGSRSYFHLHMSPWSNLPACLFGLLIAHIYFEQQNQTKTKTADRKHSLHPEETNEFDKQRNENKKPVIESQRKNNKTGKENNERNNDNGIKNRNIRDNNGVEKFIHEKQKTTRIRNKEQLNDQKQTNGTFENQLQNLVKRAKREEIKVPFLLRYAHCFTIPCLLVWVILGVRIQDVDSKAVIALYVGMERLMFSLMFAWQILQVLTIKGPWGRLMSWRGWTVPGRLALSVAMVHWCVNVTIVAARPQPVFTSLLYVSIDWLATLFYSYLIAVPVSLLVELPMKKSIDVLIS